MENFQATVIVRLVLDYLKRLRRRGGGVFSSVQFLFHFWNYCRAGKLGSRNLSHPVDTASPKKWQIFLGEDEDGIQHNKSHFLLLFASMDAGCYTIMRFIVFREDGSVPLILWCVGTMQEISLEEEEIPSIIVL